MPDEIPPEVVQSLMRLDIRKLEAEAVTLITVRIGNEVIAWFEHALVSSPKEKVGNVECPCERCVAKPPEDVVE